MIFFFFFFFFGGGGGGGNKIGQFSSCGMYLRSSMKKSHIIKILNFKKVSSYCCEKKKIKITTWHVYNISRETKCIVVCQFFCFDTVHHRLLTLKLNNFGMEWKEKPTVYLCLDHNKQKIIWKRGIIDANCNHSFGFSILNYCQIHNFRIVGFQFKYSIHSCHG